MDANERRTRASAEAAEWWLQLQSGDMSRDERVQFVIWLRESAIHVAEMLRIAQVHNALERFERWTNISTEGSVEETVVDFPHSPLDPSPAVPLSSKERATPTAGSEGAGRQNRGMRWRGAIAASLLAIGIALPLFLLSLGGQTIETERGERREVALSDGSILQVDPQTKLKVKIEKETRSITLERGRALFRVAKDPNRPFTVQADDTIVRAVGTAFAVDRRQQNIVVTVSEGKVLVSPVSAPVLPKPPESSHRSSTRTDRAEIPDSGAVPLSANQQLTIPDEGVLEAIREVNSDRELAWSEGRLVFDNATVQAAVSDFNRYNRVQLRVADQALAARPVSGVFDASDPESFIAFVQTVAHVRIVRTNGEDITIASVD